MSSEDEGARLSLHSLTLWDLFYLCVDIGLNSPCLPVLFASLFHSMGLTGLMCFSEPIYLFLLSSSFFPLLGFNGHSFWA